MAKAFSTAGKVAGKSDYCSLPQSPALPGLVAPLTLDEQIALLSVVDDTGSATFGDLIDALPKHPAPATAVQALVDAGLLRIEPVTVIDMNTRVERAWGHDTADNIGNCNLGDGSGAIERLPAGVSVLGEARLIPRVYSFSGAARSAPRHIVDLRRPGVYVAWDGDKAYVGRSETLSDRLAADHLARRKPHHIAVIVDRDGLLDQHEALVCERILFGMVAHAGGLDGLNDRAHGAFVTPEKYALLRRFVTDALVVLRESGLLFTDCTLRHLLAGPRTMPDTPVVPMVDDDAIVHQLEAAGAVARAVQSGQTWILLRGSTIRRESVQSAGASPAMRRAEMLCSGVLRDLGHAYELSAHVKFDSLSGLSQFVVGAKRGTGGWVPLNGPDHPGARALSH